jgi:hypothetical protein
MRMRAQRGCRLHAVEVGLTDTEDVRGHADAIIAMIREDQEDGQVPRDVSSWDELDDSVDTADYYRQAQMPSGTPDAAERRNAVSSEISPRLAGSQGGPWHVAWRLAGGQEQEIGRRVGHPTRAEAEAVSRGYTPSGAARFTCTAAEHIRPQAAAGSSEQRLDRCDSHQIPSQHGRIADRA